MSLSFWETTHWMNKQALTVVGGGITGIQAAISAKKANPGWPVAVLERGPLPSGASTKNAGFACIGSLSEIADDIRNIGPDRTFALMERRFRGLALLREQAGNAALNYRHGGGYEVFRQQDQATWEDAANVFDLANAGVAVFSGVEEAFRPCPPVPGMADLRSGFVSSLEGQLDPGAMMQTLHRQALELGVEIRTGWPVAAIEHTGQDYEISIRGLGSFRSDRVIVATNGFARQLLPELALRPVRNQVLITEPVPGLGWEGTFHYDRGYVYFRNVGERVLLGGFRNHGGEEEETGEFGQTDRVQSLLEAFLRDVILPGREVVIAQRWSGILGVGESREPILEEVTPGLVVAVRLGGMGVALGTLLGREAAEKLTN